MSFHYCPEFHRIMLEDKKLRIPKKFVEKYWKSVSNPIILKFPNGMEQKIFWVERNGVIYFQKNWENISMSLKYGHLLTFKYIGGPYFKVKIFGNNGLETNYANIKEVIEVESEEYESEEHESEEDESEEVIEVSEDECETQRTRNSKRKLHRDLASSSKRGGMVKKGNVRGKPFFELRLKKWYANGHFLIIPSIFSRAHLNKFIGSGELQVGKDMPMEVTFTFDENNRRSIMSGGWKPFREKYNLQVKDVCKFVMIRREPLLFTVKIN